MKTIAAFLAGLVFGLGLILARMTDPAKVLSFLDVGGRWDPSLAFVMAGAIALAVPAFRIARRRPASWLGEAINLPKASRIDARLLGGSALFGLGWGIAGFCPGPAIVALAIDPFAVGPFVLGMGIGMVLFEVSERRRAGRASSTLNSAR